MFSTIILQSEEWSQLWKLGNIRRGMPSYFDCEREVLPQEGLVLTDLGDLCLQVLPLLASLLLQPVHLVGQL